MAEQTRPPIVTILGHVDHGKTTLLDFIRKSSVAAKEHGGITQHIGAYQISVQGTVDSGQKKTDLKPVTSNLITFIDTPGHAAFEKMRSRGAKVADIAVLVVAADDGVMAQTTEAIKHIQEGKVPMMVAVNKIDLPGIDLKVQLEKIKKQLSDQKVLVEEYGGDVPIVPLSAKTGEGVNKLLEMISLVAELHELKGDPDVAPAGVVIESNLDKFKGPVATLLIRNGTLRKGDQITVGGIKARVRGMFDWNGKPLISGGPSTPVEVLGLESVVEVGAKMGEEMPRSRNKFGMTSRHDGHPELGSGSLSLVDKLRQGEDKTLKVVVKADNQGSLEAIEDSLGKFNPSTSSGQVEQMVKIVSSGTGAIGEADVKLAASIKAIILGFNVKVAPTAQKLAENEHVLIQTYNIIYELLDDIEDVIEGMVKPGVVEEVLGKANIIAEFPFGKGERIAGCRVVDGGFTKGTKMRILRDEEPIGESRLKSLRKVKEEVNRVEKGNDCGMIFDPPVDFVIGDVVEAFRVI